MFSWGQVLCIYNLFENMTQNVGLKYQMSLEVLSIINSLTKLTLCIQIQMRGKTKTLKHVE